MNQNFNIKLARALGNFASLAYFPDLPAIRDKMGVEADNWVLTCVIKNNSQALIAYNKTTKDVIISFKGTDPNDASGWLTDAKFELVRGVLRPGDGKIHSGFNDVFVAVYKDVLKVLSSYPLINNVYTTGHSLGGSLAVIFGLLNPTVSAIYTFGQPRTGDVSFAKSVNDRLGSKYIRIVNDKDIVPHLPPPILNAYRHAGQLAYINTSGQLIFNPSIYSIPSLIKGILFKFNVNIVELVRDHRIDEDYIPALSKITL